MILYKGKYLQCAICQKDAQERFRNKMPKPEQIRQVFSTLHEGRNLTECYGVKNGKWTGHRIVDQNQLYRFLRARC